MRINEINTPISTIAKMFSNIELTSDTKRGNLIIEKLYNPNKYQTKGEFFSEVMFYKLASGHSYIYPYHESKGFERSIESSQFKNVQLLPINSDNIVFDKSNDGKLSGFMEFEIFQNVYQSNYDNLITFYDTVIDENNYLRGYSRLDSLTREIYNIQLAKQGKTNKIELTGSIIVCPDEKSDQFNYSGLDQKMPTANGQLKSHKEDIEEKFREIGLANKKQIAVITKQVKAINLGESIKDIDFDADIKQDVRSIYNKYSLGREVANIDESGAKYENRDAAYMEAMQAEVIPFADYFVKNIEQFFKLNKGEIVYNFDHLPIVQKAKRFDFEKKQADAKLYAEFYAMVNKGELTPEQFNDVIKIMQ